MKPNNPSLDRLLNADTNKVQLKIQQENALSQAMLEQYEVLKTFFYQSLFRAKGTTLWMKPHTARAYITAKLLKKYEPEVDKQDFVDPEEQKRLLRELKETMLPSETNDNDANPAGKNKYKNRVMS